MDKYLLSLFLFILFIFGSLSSVAQDSLLIYPESYYSSNIGAEIRYLTPNQRTTIHTRLEDRQFFQQYEPRDDFSFMFFQIGADHWLNESKTLKAGGAYRHSSFEPINKSVHRLQGDFHFIYDFFEYRFRAQTSYNELDDRASWFFRNKFKFKVIEHGKYLNIFVDAEFFNRLNQGVDLQFIDPVRHVQRATLGNVFRFNENFKILLILRGQKRFYANGATGDIATLAGRFIFSLK